MASNRTPNTSRPMTSLQRGRACGNCRRRKIRCDGVKPRCSPCARNSRSGEDCEYTDAGLSRTQVLEANIARLEARVRELESPNQGITLYRPYDTASLSPAVATKSVVSSSETTNAYPVVSNVSSRSTSPSTGAIDDFREEPPFGVVKVLIQAFIPYATEFGFFLNMDRFLEGALLQLPIGHSARACPALLAAIYLWGVCLSQDEALVAQEQVFVTRALHNIAITLASEHPRKIIHGIQAEVLLSVYFFRVGRFLEGKYHANAANSLAVTSGLHQIRSAAQSPSVRHGHETMLPQPVDNIEEGERISGFWTVYILNNCWSAALRSPASVAFDAPGLRVDTPWPLEADQYREIPKELLGSFTVRNFLDNVTDSVYGEYSTTAMLAKASILYHRAVQQVIQCYPNMPPEEFQKFTVAFTSLDRRIERFIPSIMPMDQISLVHSSTTRTVFMTHTLAHSASMQLHTIFASTSEHSRSSCLSSALTIIDMIGTANLEHFVHINPILSFLWMQAGQLIIGEIARLRTLRPVWTDGSTAINEQNLVAALNRGFAAMTFVALTCPLLDRQVKKLRESYTSTTRN